MVLNVERGGQRLNVPITPVMLEGENCRSGIEWDTSGQMSISHPNPVEQVYDSITSTLTTIGSRVAEVRCETTAS
jgi:regulator of sigma E protease